MYVQSQNTIQHKDEEATEVCRYILNFMYMVLTQENPDPK